MLPEPHSQADFGWDHIWWEGSISLEERFSESKN
jgi:hypothetical protein